MNTNASSLGTLKKQCTRLINTRYGIIRNPSSSFLSRCHLIAPGMGRRRKPPTPRPFQINRRELFNLISSYCCNLA